MSATLASTVLTDAAAALEKLRAIIVRHEETFSALTLGPRLQIGLHCLRAHHAFCIPESKNSRGGRRSNNRVTRDSVSPEGFEGWLKTETEWLRKPTAYKYMTAVRGMGLDHESTEKQLAAALKLRLRKGPVTLAELCAAAVDPVVPALPAPQLEQTEFEFIRANLSAFREEANTLIAIAPRLRQIPDAHRAACARAYNLLRELTGSDWSPSSSPDPLSSVDPDTITI